MGKGLGQEARSDPENCPVTKDWHTIILCQSWGVDVRVGVIGRWKLDKQIDKMKNKQVHLSDWGSEARR